jgi:membrane fusion protein (multidrug efflux system)
MSSHSKGYHWIASALAPLALVTAMLGGPVPANAQTAEAPAPKVSIAAAWSQDITREATFIGRGEAADKTELAAQVTGVVTEILVEDGAQIAQGDVVLRIEPDSYAADVSAQKAALARAQANVTLAAVELGRKEELVSRGTSPESELDIARANAAVAEAEELAAAAALSQAEINLRRTEIRAPFAGRIGRIAVSPGALVGPTTGTLATLVRESPMYVAFSLSEPQLLGILERLDTGIDQLIAQDSSPNVYIQLPDKTMLEESGRIVFLDNQINASTGTISIRAEFANERRIILDGGFMTVIIEELEPVTSVLIPQNAVQRDQRGDFVLVVSDQQRVEQRYVQLGTQVETAIIVEDGLRAGESVIVEGLQRVRPGIEVNAVLTGTAEGN